MPISFESALGIHEKALHLRTKRAEVLANNLANVDTPHFKAKDIDFKAVLNSQMNSQSSAMRMSTTHSSHQSGSFSSQQSTEINGQETELLFRTPLQPSIDGNTVDEQMEQAEFMKNAMQHQASYTFLNKKFKGLSSALKGE